MSAHISPAAASAALTAQIAASNAATDAATSATSGDVAGTEPFAALFRTLLQGQPGGFGKEFSQLLLTANTDAQSSANADATTDSSLPAGDLNALLPFLEAMGFTQPLRPVQEDQEAVSDLAGSDSAVTALAVPAMPAQANSTPAISATSDAPGQARHALSTPVETGMAAQETMEAASATTAAQSDAPSKELAAGREFSSRLVEAIAASKEGERTPGSVAAAVQQVIADASPRQVHASASSQTVTASVGSSHWGDEVGNKLVWMANRVESKADLVLTPPQMGRVEVSLSISGDQATASFVSGNAAVREALEAALPRLREVLADAGIQLGQAQVGAENARQSAQQEKNGDNFPFNRGFPTDNVASHAQSGGLPVSAGLKTGRGLVDIFA